MTKKKDLSPLLLLLLRASQVLPCVLYLSHHHHYHHHVIKVRDTTTTTCTCNVPPTHEKVCLGKSLIMCLSDNSNSENCLRGSWNITLLFKSISLSPSFFLPSSHHPILPSSYSIYTYLTSPLPPTDKTKQPHQSINHEPQSQSPLPQLPLQQPKRRTRKRKRKRKKPLYRPRRTNHLLPATCADPDAKKQIF